MPSVIPAALAEIDSDGVTAVATASIWPLFVIRSSPAATVEDSLSDKRLSSPSLVSVNSETSLLLRPSPEMPTASASAVVPPSRTLLPAAPIAPAAIATESAFDTEVAVRWPVLST